MCFNLRKAARAITQLYDEALRPTGLRATQLSILGATMTFGPMTITKLADGMVTDRTTLTRNLRLLQRQGLVTVGAGKDRREHQVAVTEKGRAVMVKAHPLWKRVQGRVTKELGQVRCDRLLADLSAVVKASKCC